MILANLGKLAIAQSFPAGSATDSENVLGIHTDAAGIDYSNLTDVWFVVDTYSAATGDSSDTYKFALVVAKEAALTNIKEIVAVTITDYEDPRLATPGNHIIAVNVGKMLKDALGDDGSDYEFVGMIGTISAGAAVYVDASLSPSEPPTVSHAMLTESPVGTITVASDGSGA